jgi:hypothetical protein
VQTAEFVHRATSLSFLLVLAGKSLQRDYNLVGFGVFTHFKKLWKQLEEEKRSMHRASNLHDYPPKFIASAHC